MNFPLNSISGKIPILILVSAVGGLNVRLELMRKVLKKPKTIMNEIYKIC
jgi:hypothetical protein